MRLPPLRPEERRPVDFRTRHIPRVLTIALPPLERLGRPIMLSVDGLGSQVDAERDAMMLLREPTLSQCATRGRLG